MIAAATQDRCRLKLGRVCGAQWGTCVIRVRRAITDDIPWIVDQLREFSCTLGTARGVFPGDGLATDYLDNLIKNHLLLVAEEDRPDPVLVGFIAGLHTPHFFNPEISVLAELFWWVTPADRGSSAGARLLQEFIEYGREHADWIMMTLEETSPVRSDAMERRGFKVIERSFLLEVA